ncbi:hypothetical protein QMA79_18590 [Pseudomonas aeruginosa]|uniref:hypothetical protein n=1 Tax=Pseudomonas aeruginosa TaxID=287 RepID=UPI0024AD5A90|nr:hypothetical protein [Pseudomonas aeruginosa]MDI6671823.1 hypothetical protein [Pseudomonas aeruginosa]
MTKLFNAEKVLWLASQEKPLHVSPKEAACFSDLDGIVEERLAAGHLEKCDSDDSGDYYRCTKAGLIDLYKMKIAWRKKNGKSIEKEMAKLNELLASAS